MIVTITEPKNWGRRPRCAGAAHLMFDEERLDEAKALCDGCPARRKCLDYALDGDLDFGVWGGLTFEERTRLCPVCHGDKEPSALACNGPHTLLRLARLVEQQRAGDPTVSVSHRPSVSAPTTPGCVVPRGRSHATGKAYREGCRCAAARVALYRERALRPPSVPQVVKTRRDRFLSRVEVVEEGHWWWRGGVNGSGYGNFWDGQRTVRAHLYAYGEFVGPIPERARLHPVANCESRLCVNPEHYELVDAA